MTAPTTSPRPQPSLTRRALVQSAAWTVPTLTLVAPVAAYATSAGAVLQIDGMFANGAVYSVAGRPTMVESGFSVQNVWSSTSPTITGITVTVSFPDSRVTGGAATIVSGSGWTAGTPVHSGGMWTYTFTYIAGVAPAGSTSNLVYRVPLVANTSGSMAIQATATAAHATAATSSVTAWI